MNDEQREKANTILQHYGATNQRHQLIEECAELIQAISKIYRRGCGPDIPPDAYENLVEECADVLIIIEQMLEMYEIPDHELQRMVDYKCKRQEERMNESLGRNP